VAQFQQKKRASAPFQGFVIWTVSYPGLRPGLSEYAPLGLIRAAWWVGLWRTRHDSRLRSGFRSQPCVQSFRKRLFVATILEVL